MKDNSRNKKTNEQLAKSSVKKAVDGVYDLIMGNALFMLFNLHILLFLLFYNPTNIVMYYLYMAVLSLNLLPSYSALLYAVSRKRAEGKGIFKDFVKGYRENLKSSLLIGLLGAVLITFTLYNALFFYISEMNLVYVLLQLLIFFMLFTILATVPVMVHEKGTLKEVLGKTMNRFFRLMLGAAAAVVILLMSVYLGRIVIMTLIFGFALAAMAQNALYFRLLGQSQNRI
ncbi:DUF624 domain-containing protein [Proteiniclasticum sp. C24MP]|uniref:DUF624 domain-containing protein n=1 Tax=Proteiniclasticum sp. C24MP TaxID=3374101 RepID=UPI003754F935